MADGLQLELELAKAEPGRFLVTVRSPAGEETGELRLDAVSLLAQRSHLQSTVLASAVTSRRALAEVEAPVRRVGELLFRSLFHAGVYGTYKASVALTQQQGVPLRIVLRTQVPELAALPWEMLYDAGAGTYLCQRDPLVRHVAVSAPTRPLEVRPPLRILGMVAAPKDKQRLDVEGEKRRLTTALGGLGGLVQVHWVRGGSWVDLQGELVSGSWHVVHFIGHGGFDMARGEGVLALEDEHGASDLVGADRFSQLLTTQVPPPQLIVLNSCAGAQAAADDLFSSTAAALVRAGVSASVAMQFAVSDPAAKAFAAGFYQAIAHNHTVADAVRIGRIGICGTSEDTLEWVTPALYMRGNDAPLFTVLRGSEADGESVEGPTPEQAARLAGAQALYQQAMSHFRAQRFHDAVALFDSLLSLQPGYRDAEARRAAASTRQQADDAYQDARVAEDSSDWDAAVAGYGEVLRLDPEHSDAAQRQQYCRHRRRVSDLFDELRQHLKADDWTAAAATADELQMVDPNADDPEGLVERVRRASVTEPVEPRVPQQSRRPPDTVIEQSLVRQEPAIAQPPRPSEPVIKMPRSAGDTPPTGRRYVIGAAITVALVTAGAFAVWAATDDGTPPTGPPSDGGEVAAPFESATLYGMANPLFAASDCFIPDRQDAPVASKLPHIELVKCVKAPYKATFLCASTVDDFRNNQQTFLGYAVPGTQRDVSGAPAGQSGAIDGLQRAFVHKGGHGARVYWDSPSTLCAGELQAETDDVAAAIDYWRNGYAS